MSGTVAGGGASGNRFGIRLSLDGGQGVVSELNAVAAAGERAMQRFREGGEAAGRGLAEFRGLIGQAGFQVQDFAVQVASGQNALTAFAQQGSQLAGAFGPFHILVRSAENSGPFATDNPVIKRARDTALAILKPSASQLDASARTRRLAPPSVSTLTVPS